MNVLNPQTHQVDHDASDSAPSDPGHARIADEVLPACFLLGIISGFIAFVVFGQAILPALIAAAVGGLLGLFLACERTS